MRFRSPSVCILILLLSGRVTSQATQDQSAGHAHEVVGALGARPLAVKEFTTLPRGALFLRFENFSTAGMARRVATPASAVVEWAG